MFCRNCGKEIKDGSTFCPYCGQQIMKADLKKETVEVKGSEDLEQQKKNAKKAKWKAFDVNYFKIRRKIRRICLVILIICAIIECIRSVNQKPAGTENTVNETEVTEEASTEQAETNNETESDTDTTSELPQESEEPANLEWEGDYIRQNGPAASISIWEADENGMTFAYSIGISGYTAYVDLRDCEASYVDNQTYEYDYSYDDVYGLVLTKYETGEIQIAETGENPFGMSLAGIYDLEENADYPTCEFVFPNSDTEELTMENCVGLTSTECRIARNEIYARHGRMFQDEQLQGYFDSCSWYNGTVEPDDFTDEMLNDIEKYNLELISEYESGLTE